MSDTYSIVLNDTTKFKISDNGVREFKTQIKGVSANAIEFTVNESTSDMIKAKFSSKFNTAIIKLYNVDGIVTKTFEQYDILKSIAIDLISSEDGKESYLVTLVKSTGYDERLTRLETKMDKFVNQLNISLAEPDPDKMSVDELKNYMILMTKKNFSEYLEANPIKSSAHGSEDYYSCTAEKQTLLMSAIAIAQLHASVGDTNYKSSWNASGKPCTYDWTLQQLGMLAMELELFVHPLLSCQQIMESMIKAASTKEELNQIPITFPPDPMISNILTDEMSGNSNAVLTAIAGLRRSEATTVEV